jgi:hypothetical protein
MAYPHGFKNDYWSHPSILPIPHFYLTSYHFIQPKRFILFPAFHARPSRTPAGNTTPTATAAAAAATAAATAATAKLWLRLPLDIEQPVCIPIDLFSGAAAAAATTTTAWSRLEPIL